MPARYRLFSAVLALTLLLVQGMASAHDIDHALGHHDSPCALHVLASHSPGAPTAPVMCLIPPRRAIAQTVAVVVSLPDLFTPSFSARAPPRFT